jgi:hypothetical protein
MKQPKPRVGSRIIASLKQAVDWAEGKDVAVRVTTVEVSSIDVIARHAEAVEDALRKAS